VSVAPPGSKVAVIGAGPCGLAAAISLRAAGFDAVVFDAGSVVSSIVRYPTYATFFSTAEKLSIGGIPFVTAGDKPTRRDALAYYRAIVMHFGIPVRPYETVTAIDGRLGAFTVHSRTRDGAAHETAVAAVVIATGYFGAPNAIGVPGEELSHVSHTYHEGHGAFQQDTVVVGGGNSAAEAALDLYRTGARVTLVHFGPTFDMKIKPWVLPDFMNRVAEGAIGVRWNSRVEAITSTHVRIRGDGGVIEELPAGFVFLMTGFAPRVELLRQLGVPIDEATGVPSHDPETLETTVPGVFIAGVINAGYDANKIFIENGRYHGERIVARLAGRAVPETPGASRDIDG
jgi:thioredoxin reductase (NADPH)